MSLPHIRSGEVISVHPLGDALKTTASTAFVKSSQLEIMRLVLTEGKSVPEHQVNGELTLQCIEGAVEVRMQAEVRLLRPGELLFLTCNVPYSLHALDDTSVLMTVVVEHE